VAPSGSAEKNLNMGAQLQIIPHLKALKTFLKIAQHNSVLVSTKGGTAHSFWHYLNELDSFL